MKHIALIVVPVMFHMIVTNSTSLRIQLDVDQCRDTLDTRQGLLANNGTFEDDNTTTTTTTPYCGAMSCCTQTQEEKLLAHAETTVRHTMRQAITPLIAHLEQRMQTIRDTISTTLSQLHRNAMTASKQAFANYAYLVHLNTTLRWYTHNLELAMIDVDHHNDDIALMPIEMFKRIFPNAFVCAVLFDRCEYVEQSYIRCLRSHYDQIKPFGYEPQLYGQELEQFVQPVRLIWTILFELRDLLLDLNDRFENGDINTNGCTRPFMTITDCTQCVLMEQEHNEEPICASLCDHTMDACLASVGITSVFERRWQQLMVRLRNLVRVQSGIASSTENTVMGAFAGRLANATLDLVELDTPRVAKKVRRLCDRLSIPTFVSKTRLRAVESLKRQFRSAKRTQNKSSGDQSDKNIKTLIWMSIQRTIFEISATWHGHWRRVRQLWCREGKPDDNNCWNGTHIGSYSTSSQTPGSATGQTGKSSSQHSAPTHKLVDVQKKLDSHPFNTDLFDVHERFQSDQPRIESDLIDQNSGDTFGGGWSNNPPQWKGDGLHGAYIDDEDFVHGSGSGDGEDPSRGTVFPQGTIDVSPIAPTWPQQKDNDVQSRTYEVNTESNNQSKLGATTLRSDVVTSVLGALLLTLLVTINQHRYTTD